MSDIYEEVIHKSRYARWDYTLNSRETWKETVDRVMDYLATKFDLPQDINNELYDAICNKEIMPSMRLMWSAGKSSDKSNLAIFNCSYVAVDDPKVFDEIMFILLNGTGVGFSVDRAEIAKLPVIPDELYDTDTTIIVRDSKLGWATAFRELISLLYSGKVPSWDLSKLRPAGAILKTTGGRASGGEVLGDLFNYTVNLFKASVGRKFTSIDCHGLVCKIAEVVVVGGVRRSALISLSNLSDDRMRHAKSGQWWLERPEYSLANNSAIYTEKPDSETFMREWLALVESKSGERGIFNVEASYNNMPERRQLYLTLKGPTTLGTNPCGEIVLQSKGLCNLSSVIIRKDDTYEDLKRKVKLATILGTLQCMFTKLPYVSKKWVRNLEEERLLGVSLTGIMDHTVMSGSEHRMGFFDTTIDWEDFVTSNTVNNTLADVLRKLNEVATETNIEWADKYDIPHSLAITTVKPEGTVSQLVNSSSGIHPRYSEYYIRTIRQSKKDPLSQFLIDTGIPYEEAEHDSKTIIFSFPIKSPEGAVLVKDVSAIQQMELWMVYKKYWADHNVSCTIYVKDNEWLEVGAWVYKNFDTIGGLAFLPHTSHIYKQAPYTEITKVEYEEACKLMPSTLDWNKLEDYEKEDYTVGAQTLACTGSATCEI